MWVDTSRMKTFPQAGCVVQKPRPAASARCRAAFKVIYVFAYAGTNVGSSLFHHWLALSFPKCLLPDVITGTFSSVPRMGVGYSR